MIKKLLAGWVQFFLLQKVDRERIERAREYYENLRTSHETEKWF